MIYAVLAGNFFTCTKDFPHWSGTNQSCMSKTFRFSTTEFGADDTYVDLAIIQATFTKIKCMSCIGKSSYFHFFLFKINCRHCDFKWIIKQIFKTLCFIFTRANFKINFCFIQIQYIALTTSNWMKLNISLFSSWIAFKYHVLLLLLSRFMKLLFVCIFLRF